jgi:hypothetical protein
LSSPTDSEVIAALRSELEKLKNDYSLLLQERNRIAGEISSLGESLSECQRSRAELESALRRIKSTELSPSFSEASSGRLDFLEKEVESLSKTSNELENLTFRSLIGEPGIRERLRDFILREGSLKYRVLLVVSEKGSVEISEIARLTGIDRLDVEKAIQTLSMEQKVEAHGSLITVRGVFKPPPIEEWRGMTIDKVFDEVEKYCTLVRSPDLIGQALQTLKDLVEEKVRSRGTFVFDIGKEIQQWRRGLGNLQDLQFRLRDWKSRAR